jgi:hypothetical protein
MFLEESKNTFITMNSKGSLPGLQWARGGRHETKGQPFPHSSMRMHHAASQRQLLSLSGWVSPWVSVHDSHWTTISNEAFPAY